MQSHGQVGKSFCQEKSLRAQDISSFAHAFWDFNPWHHDPNCAPKTRFQGIIASGSDISGLMMGMTASSFSGCSAMLGLEFSFSFLQPLQANENIRLEWLVLELVDKPSLLGELVKRHGKALEAVDETCVRVLRTVLVTQSL
jgi:acyl dehydratase